MAKRLYHFTSRDCAIEIVANGFQGECWLSDDPHTVCGEDARSALLEVTLDLSDDALAEFAQEVEDEEIDPDTDEPLPGGIVDRYVWYKIPAHILGQVTTRRRLVASEERRQLMA